MPEPDDFHIDYEPDREEGERPSTSSPESPATGHQTPGANRPGAEEND